MKKNILLLLLCLGLILSCSKDDSNGNSGIVKALNKQNIGSSSNDLLSIKKYTSLIIELVYVEGSEPSQEAIDNLISFLNKRIYKNEIIVEKRSIPASIGGGTTYTIEQIKAIEDSNRTKYNTSDQIAVWLFFADGKSSGDTATEVVLGSAYRNTSLVIFDQTVKKWGRSNRILLEKTVIDHEFGHILGLTNLGAKMQSAHEDEDIQHKKHCNVESCLMYWKAQVNMISGGSEPEMDAQCLADLQANGGK